MVAGVGTIVIDPPEGDMAEYLKQLRAAQNLPVRAVHPAHRPPIPDGPAPSLRCWITGRCASGGSRPL